MKNLILSALALSGLCLGGQAQEEVAPQMQYAEATASTDFAVDMFRSLAQRMQGNLIYSPAGIETVLNLLKQGARGNTAAELNSLPLGQQAALSALNPDEAEALFIAKSLTLNPAIKADSVYTVPFESNPTEAAQQINDWVSLHTNGRIPAIVSANGLSPLTRLVAANAIYLQEKWLHPFNKISTQPNTMFTKADGSIELVDMMYNRDEYIYAEGEDWQAVAMFYDTMGRMGEPGCFIGILPKGNAREFARSLTPYKYRTILQALVMSSEHDTIVRLPRFELTTAPFSLVPALRACGLNDLFTPAADFSGFCNEPLYLSDVLQRCYVKTDEEGTEAVAATAVVIICSAAAPPPSRPREINFNRPFIWVIGNLNVNSTPYFMGITEEP